MIDTLQAFYKNVCGLVHPVTRKKYSALTLNWNGGKSLDCWALISPMICPTWTITLGLNWMIL